MKYLYEFDIEGSRKLAYYGYRGFKKNGLRANKLSLFFIFLSGRCVRRPAKKWDLSLTAA